MGWKLIKSKNMEENEALEKMLAIAESIDATPEDIEAIKNLFNKKEPEEINP